MKIKIKTWSMSASPRIQLGRAGMCSICLLMLHRTPSKRCWWTAG